MAFFLYFGMIFYLMGQYQNPLLILIISVILWIAPNIIAWFINKPKIPEEEFIIKFTTIYDLHDYYMSDNDGSIIFSDQEVENITNALNLLEGHSLFNKKFSYEDVDLYLHYSDKIQYGFMQQNNVTIECKHGSLYLRHTKNNGFLYRKENNVIDTTSK